MDVQPEAAYLVRRSGHGMLGESATATHQHARSSMVEACQKAGNAAGVSVLFNKRAPFAKLNTDELVVRSWAWDSNTLPGKQCLIKVVFWS